MPPRRIHAQGRITRSGTPKKRIPVGGRIKRQVATEPMALAPVRPPRQLARVRDARKTGRWPPRRPYLRRCPLVPRAAQAAAGPPRPRLKGQATGAGGESQINPSSGHGQAAVGSAHGTPVRGPTVPSPWRFRPSRQAGVVSAARKTAPRQASIDTPESSATRRAAPHAQPGVMPGVRQVPPALLSMRPATQRKRETLARHTDSGTGKGQQGGLSNFPQEQQRRV
ncbi:MAG: hypothetical protein IPL59_17395 [Candidatus Competibacteraceae bacterium]|nr:hypothetical protein [Candidatus Competibacteraceae bacterium]